MSRGKRELTAADLPARLGCSRRMMTCPQLADCCMYDLQELCWPGLKGLSLTRKILHCGSERARTDHPYRGPPVAISTAFAN